MNNIALLIMLATAAPAPADAGGEIIARARALQTQLETTTEAPHAARVAEQLSPVIEDARNTDLKPEELETLRRLLRAMQSRARRLLADAEYRTGQDEARLERLYRSRAWDDLGFAEAAFIYHRAWIDLEMAGRALLEKDRILARARKGFQTASLQLFRPNLFYGGWLGIASVDIEQGHSARARQILKKLDDALSAWPEAPVNPALSLEIRLQAARLDKAATDGAGNTIEAEQAERLRMEVFALLEQQGSAAGRHLQALIEASGMDQSLLETMMTYSRQIAALDLDPWNRLAAAEFRLQHQDYRQALRQYEAFFNAFIPQEELNLDGFRYNQAFAAYKADQLRTALRILEKLERQTGLAPEVNKSVARLLYSVHVARELRGDAQTDSESLYKAAQNFVAASPDDPDADSARLLLAQASQDTDSALRTLKRIRSTAKFDGAVERTAFYVVAREFNARITTGRTQEAVGPAIDGMDAFDDLPDADRNKPLNIAMLIQMRALAGPDPALLISALDFLDDLKDSDEEDRADLVAAHPDHIIRTLGAFIIRGDVDSTVQQALAWSRLQLYDRTGNRTRLAALIQSPDENGAPGLSMELLYPWIAERADISQRLELAQLAQPSATALPDVDRRFYRLIIEDLLSMNHHSAAHKKALAFTREHPNSGDAWRLLARAAELDEQPFTADRAWNVITDKVLPSTDLWWEGMLNRVRIRAGSTRPEQACPLLEQLQKMQGHLPDSQKATFETLSANTTEKCRATDS